MCSNRIGTLGLNTILLEYSNCHSVYVEKAAVYVAVYVAHAAFSFLMRLEAAVFNRIRYVDHIFTISTVAHAPHF